MTTRKDSDDSPVPRSPEKFVKDLTASPAKAKQALRRAKALEKLVMGTLTQKVPSRILRKTVSDATVAELMKTPRAEREGVVLLPEYAHLLMPEGKNPIRFPYPGEVGYYERDGETVFLFLEEAKGKGHIVSKKG